MGFMTSGQIDYPTYLGDILRSASYQSGGTDTATGLTEIYKKDLVTSRQLGKNETIVFVFTARRSARQASVFWISRILHLKNILAKFANASKKTADQKINLRL